MAVAFDGFSIREYTSKMRSIDVLKCWPFSTTSSSDVTKEDLKSCLPPMTVPKFRWWSDELDAVRSDRGKSENQPSDDEISLSESESVRSEKSAGAEEEKMEMVCPVCRVFNAATLTAVNAHIDGCLAQTMKEERRHMKMMSLKSKSKAPKKKRSIAEIFEVEVEQPQIQTVLNFWPFDKNPDGVSITVTKFRWLTRRLEELRSNQSEGESSRKETESAKSGEVSGRDREEEKLEMVCPVCRVFNAATVTAVNAHIDGCLAQAMREERRHMRMNLKPKPKAPKKRSIAEILTLAPQIEVKSSELQVDIDDEEEEENGEEEKSDGGGDSTINSKKNMNKNRKKKKMEKSWKKKLKKKSKVEKYKLYSDVTLDNEKKKMNKKKKKKKNSFNKGLNAKKEDSSKRKVKTQVNSARKLKGIIDDERVALDDIHKKKASLKYVSVEKKQIAVSPIRGILKNHSTHISGNTSSGCNIQDDTEERPCDVQGLTSTRHVRFSNEDDILGPKKRNSFDEKMHSLSSDGRATLLVKEQCSGSDEEAASLEVNKSDSKIAFNLDRKKEDCHCPVVESKQFSNIPEQVTGQNFVRPCINQEKAKHLIQKSESSTKVPSLGDNNNNSLYLFDRGNTTALHCSAYTCINTQVGDSGAYSSEKFIDHLGNSTYQVAAMNSDANTRTFLQPSSLCSTSGNQASEGSLFSPQTYTDNDLGYIPLSHTFSADMTHNSYPTSGWEKRDVRKNCMNVNFFGLPLNSQGGLINFSSSGKGGMNQFETSSMSRSSSSGLPVNNTAYHQVPNDCANQLPHYPARLGVTELQGSERADMLRPNTDMSFNHYLRPIDSELNLMKYPFVEQNHHERVPNHEGNGMISLKESSDLSSTQPTMRLMGKDVPIGRSIKEVKEQHLEEEHVWDDQQSRRRHYYENATLQNSLSKTCSQHDCISGSPLQISSENVTRSVRIQSNQALMNGPDSEFPQPFPDLQTHPDVSRQKGSRGFSKISSCDSLSITHHPHTSCAVFNGAPYDFPEQLINGAKPLGHGSHLQVQPLVTKSSAFEFPFVHPAVREHAKTSLFQSSYTNLPPWMLSSTHEKLISRSFPHNEYWGGYFTTPVNHSSQVLNPPNPLTSPCHMKTPLGPASDIQPPSSTMCSGSRHITKVTDTVVLDDKTRKDDNQWENTTRKRPAAYNNLDEESRKPIKLRNIELTGFPRESSRAVEFDPCGDSARRSKCCCPNEGQSVNSKSYNLGFESSNLDGMVMSGPVRPSPGAKHILKPSPTRPIHSAIPIAASTDSGRDILDIQRKMTKIYRF